MITLSFPSEKFLWKIVCSLCGGTQFSLKPHESSVDSLAREITNYRFLVGIMVITRVTRYNSSEYVTFYFRPGSRSASRARVISIAHLSRRYSTSIIRAPRESAARECTNYWAWMKNERMAREKDASLPSHSSERVSVISIVLLESGSRTFLAIRVRDATFR